MADEKKKTEAKGQAKPAPKAPKGATPGHKSECPTEPQV